eukprot:gene22297-30540_t
MVLAILSFSAFALLSSVNAFIPGNGVGRRVWKNVVETENNNRNSLIQQIRLRAQVSDEGESSGRVKYCENVYRTNRRPTRTITVGKVPIGSEHPIAKQTMTTTVTRDVESSVNQILKIAAEGGDLVRLTVQGRFEADACMKIRESLWEKGCDVPLVADIHFSPPVAMRVADAFEKVRINPGNFADGIKSFENKVYNTREEYDRDVEEIEKLFAPLVLKCKEKNRALRIGTNHGSLSARVMSFWGDSPRGMVESAVEFAKICRKYDFHNFLFSMKASNPVVMVQAYRLLAAEQYKLGWDYPLHLGVTEAGEGEDGRMKSAIGIGSLLADGLGDTVRVSLTEDPEFELKPCTALINIGQEYLDPSSTKFDAIPAWEETIRDVTTFSRRRGPLPAQKEGDQIDVRGFLHRDGSVLSSLSLGALKNTPPEELYKQLGAKLAVGMPFKDVATVDSIYLPEVPLTSDAVSRRTLKRLQEVSVGIIAPIDQLQANPLPNAVALVNLQDVVNAGLPPLPPQAIRFAVKLTGLEPAHMYGTLKSLLVLAGKDSVITAILEVPPHASRVHASRRVFQLLHDNDIDLPVILSLSFQQEQLTDKDQLILRSGSEGGALLVDGLGDGVMISISNPSSETFDLNTLRVTSFNLLQGSRMRSVKTDFVSCPSCGRTLFDLQEVTEQIKQKTGHLPGVAIAIMGCIVNGPGEMADADFGYVGGAPGKVDLYVGKEVVQRGIANELACDALVQLIKDNGRWQDPPSNDDDTSSGPIEGSSSKELAAVNFLFLTSNTKPQLCIILYTTTTISKSFAKEAFNQGIMKERDQKIKVVFISGFLTPHNWISYPVEVIPSNISMIPVFPSPVASIHDRACQVFYELVGGVVDYGEEHAAYHKHNRYGMKFEGKLQSWSENCPIIIVGHSLGGNTALALQYYLEAKRFANFPNTSAKWIAGIVTVNSPLNGSLLRLLKALFGFCLHSTTDNIAYDASVQSQLAWNAVHVAYKSTYYLSMVGNMDENSSTGGMLAVVRSLVAFLMRDNGLKHDKISGIDVSNWATTGGDGLLSVHTQEFPRLMSYIGLDCPSSKKYDSLPSNIIPGLWHYIHRNHSHIAPAFACLDTWKLIWDGCALIDTACQEARPADMPVFTPSISEISNVVDDDYNMSNSGRKVGTREDHHEAILRSSSDRPDMQRVYMSVDKRIFQYHLGICEPLKLSSSRIYGLALSVALIYIGWTKADVLIYAGVITLAMTVMNSATLLSPREGKKSSFAWSSDGLQTFFVATRVVCLLYGNVQCQPMLLYLESVWEVLCPHLCYSNYSTWWVRLGVGAVTSVFLAKFPSPAVLQFFAFFFAHFAVVSLLPIGGWKLLAFLENNPEYINHWTLGVLSNLVFAAMVMSYLTSSAIIMAPTVLFPYGIALKTYCCLVPFNIYAYFKVHQDISEGEEKEDDDEPDFSCPFAWTPMMFSPLFHLVEMTKSHD